MILSQNICKITHILELFDNKKKYGDNKDNENNNLLNLCGGNSGGGNYFYVRICGAQFLLKKYWSLNKWKVRHNFYPQEK